MSDNGDPARPQTITLPSIASTNTLFTHTIKTRSHFALHHMHSAVKAARRAHEIEITHSEERHGPWHDEMLHTVPVAIIMAAAALEAQINEAVQDILDRKGADQPGAALRLLLKELKDGTAGDTLAKCRQVLLLLGAVPDTGRREWEETKLLLTLRNRFIHFKPAWDHDEVHDSKWVKELKRLVPIYAPYAKRFQFPYGFITYGTAKWAITTALNFAAHITPLLGVPNRFAKQDYSLSEN